jgi:uncharacterized protein YaeQ
VKFSFQLSSEDKRRPLPRKVIIGRRETETHAQVLLKLLGYLMFFRERLQIATRLPDDNIPFVPDLAQLDYELQPRLWVECGECTVAKLDKLAVKAHTAEIWVLKHSVTEAQQLFAAMAKEDLRRDRYQLIGFEESVFEEMLNLLHSRNEVLWVGEQSDPPALQLDFNGLWFDLPFEVLRF